MTEIPRYIAVIDIGKSNVKLALVDRAKMVELAVLTRPNHVLPGPPFPHFDVDGHWAFFLAGLTQFEALHGIDGISITTHGACAALLDTHGQLAAPVLDYEHAAPDKFGPTYDALRPNFAVTGSPRLGRGLNLGAQLYWLLARDATLQSRVAHVVTWPQYWGYVLTGNMACDVSSLGCHTDLWEPATGSFSDLVGKLGLGGKMALPRKPNVVLGCISPAVASATGMKPTTPVVCGIHDSNASLLPHLLTQNAPFAVVSTGTWVVCMAVGSNTVTLDASRDVLVNVAADGSAVPSARFMGGREYEVICRGRNQTANVTDELAVLAAGMMLWPSVMADGGPYPGRQMKWSHAPEKLNDAEGEVVLSFYLALMTATCLTLTGAAGPVIVEGPFAANPAYCRMLAAATGRPVMRAESQTGTGIGAALLFGAPAMPPPLTETITTENMDDYRRYALAWQAVADA